MKVTLKRCLLLGLTCLSLAGCKQPLLKNLDQRQANEVLATLQRYGISAQKMDTGKTGYQIELDEKDFPSAVDLLKAYDLPSRKAVEISDFFPGDTLVSSPLAERARLYSAQEQRLEQSLRNLEHVVAARVHISYPLKDDGSQPLHVSALLLYQGQVDKSLLIAEVKRFLKNGLDGIDYDNIAVVLANGTPQQYDLAPKVKTVASPFGPLALVAGVIICLLLLGAGGLGWYRWRQAKLKDA